MIKVQVVSHETVERFTQEHCFLRKVLLIPVVLKWRMERNTDGMILTLYNNGRTQTKTCRSTNLSTADFSWTDMRSKLGLRGERPKVDKVQDNSFRRLFYDINKYVLIFFSRESWLYIRWVPRTAPLSPFTATVSPHSKSQTKRLLSIGLLHVMRHSSAVAEVRQTWYSIQMEHTVAQLVVAQRYKPGRSRVQFPKVSLEFFIDTTLPATLWRWGWLSL